METLKSGAFMKEETGRKEVQCVSVGVIHTFVIARVTGLTTETVT